MSNAVTRRSETQRVLSWPARHLGWTALVLGVIGLIVPGIWLLSVLCLAPGGGPRRQPLAWLSIGTYAVALALPAAWDTSWFTSERVTYWGWQAVTLLGLSAEPLAWMANPAFVVGLSLYRLSRFGWSGAVAVVATLLALTVALPIHDGSLFGDFETRLEIGYAVWAAAPGILIIAAGVAPTSSSSASTM